MKEGFVKMYHPVTGGLAEVSEEAFEVEYSGKGWILDDGTHEPTQELIPAELTVESVELSPEDPVAEGR